MKASNPLSVKCPACTSKPTEPCVSVWQHATPMARSGIVVPPHPERVAVVTLGERQAQRQRLRARMTAPRRPGNNPYSSARGW